MTFTIRSQRGLQPQTLARLLPVLAACSLLAADKPPAAEKQGGSIEAKEFRIELLTGLSVYTSNVVVEDPEMGLRCDVLKLKYVVGGAPAPAPAPVKTNAPAAPLWGGRKVEWADAVGHVILVDRKNDARVEGGRAIFTATNNLLHLPGSGIMVKPHNATTNWMAALTNHALVPPQVIFYGDDLMFDREKGTVSGRNHKTFYWADLVKTNAPVAPKPENKK